MIIAYFLVTILVVIAGFFFVWSYIWGKRTAGDRREFTNRRSTPELKELRAQIKTIRKENADSSSPALTKAIDLPK
jgi:hypothetical protein